MLAYAGKGRFVVQLVNLTDLVREVNTLIQSAIPKHVQLRVSLGSNLPSVEADIGQLQQVVMNLVINAAEAMGSEPGTVLVTTNRQTVDEEYLATLSLADGIAPGNYVLLEVHDTGVGMDAATIGKIFDPFFTTKFHGRGLGLAAVQGIVRSHRGGIKVYSTPGKGTTFKVLLPAITAPATSLLPRQREQDGHLRGDGVILVIDDEAFVRNMARSTLERYGYTVLVAENGQEGVDIFKAHAHEVRLVLLDLTMPLMDGQEALRRIRVIDSRARVILSSGFNESEAIRQFTGKGLSGFLQKPYTAAALAAKVKEALPDNLKTAP
jgi:CheY-like chemotaxis protein